MRIQKKKIQHGGKKSWIHFGKYGKFWLVHATSKCINKFGSPFSCIRYYLRRVPNSVYLRLCHL